MSNHFQNRFCLEDIFIIAVIYYAMIKTITYIANGFLQMHRKKLLVIRGLPR